MKQVDTIIKYVYDNCVVPVRGKQTEFTIIAGDVHDKMGLQNRVPNVCNALQGIKFQALSNIKLIKAVGPESGQARSMKYTYTFNESIINQPDLVEWDKL